MIILVLTFLWIKRITLDGLQYAGKQWGLTETNEYGTAWVSFPISFKIPIPIVVAIHNGLDAVSAYISSDNRNTTQVAIVLRKNADNSVLSRWGVGWIAIGF